MAENDLTKPVDEGTMTLMSQWVLAVAGVFAVVSAAILLGVMARARAPESSPSLVTRVTHLQISVLCGITLLPGALAAYMVLTNGTFELDVKAAESDVALVCSLFCVAFAFPIGNLVRASMHRVLAQRCAQEAIRLGAELSRAVPNRDEPGASVELTNFVREGTNAPFI